MKGTSFRKNKAEVKQFSFFFSEALDYGSRIERYVRAWVCDVIAAEVEFPSCSKIIFFREKSHHFFLIIFERAEELF